MVSEQSSTKSEQAGDSKQEIGNAPSADSFARLKGNISALGQFFRLKINWAAIADELRRLVWFVLLDLYIFRR